MSTAIDQERISDTLRDRSKMMETIRNNTNNGSGEKIQGVIDQIASDPSMKRFLESSVGDKNILNQVKSLPKAEKKKVAEQQRKAENAKKARPIVRVVFMKTSGVTRQHPYPKAEDVVSWERVHVHDDIWFIRDPSSTLEPNRGIKKLMKSKPPINGDVWIFRLIDDVITPLDVEDLKISAKK